MKKLIDVPVGCEPVVKCRPYSNEEYLVYGRGPELSPDSSLKGLISDLNRMLVKHRDRYQDMSFKRQDCDCPFECSCSPSYVLYGKRYETDVEYQFRLRKEAKQKDEQYKRELAEYKKLRAKFENEGQN